MPITFWFGLLKVVLSMANNIAGYLRTQKAMDAGAKAETGRQLVAIMQRAGVTEQVRAEISTLTDAELDDELRGP